jgi:Family of unknown function (DUF6768)
MSDIDNKIRSALQKEVAELGLEDDGRILTIRDLIRSTYVGQTRWMSITSYVKTVLFFATAVFAAVMFFRSEEVKALIGWATLCGIAMMSVGMMATFFFLIANRNAQIREIKRLELQLAGLQEQHRSSP